MTKNRTEEINALLELLRNVEIRLRKLQLDLDREEARKS
jgi:hypothetical protein